MLLLSNVRGRWAGLGDGEPTVLAKQYFTKTYLLSMLRLHYFFGLPIIFGERDGPNSMAKTCWGWRVDGWFCGLSLLVWRVPVLAKLSKEFGPYLG